MLPWVLLYGLTALLFNHPNVLTAPGTEVAYFSLDDAEAKLLPDADQLAEKAVTNVAAVLKAADSSQSIEIATPSNASFSRQMFGSTSNDEFDASVVVDFATGKGYLKKRKKKEEPKEPKEDAKPSLENKIDIKLDADPVGDFRKGVASLLKESDFDAEKVRIRSLPALEFDAIVDGEPMRMKLVQKSGGRGRSGSDNTDKKKDKPVTYDATLSVVGQHPRDMSARSFLLRLHMAHGYPNQANVRWFWAVAVDLMFASMVFWGLSGVVMWWQIKRTRKIGFVILGASAIVALWLAIGMHWQLVNG